MYCPKCGYEYREGFLKCPDCGSTLLPGSSTGAAKDKRDEPSAEYVEFVAVMRTGRLWEVEMVENALAKAGIPHYQQSETSRGLVLAKQLSPSMGPGEWWSFWVPKSLRSEVEEILATLPIDVTTNPGVWHFNPPAEGKWFFKSYAVLVLAVTFISLILFLIDLFRK